jgi:hypothetical protein
MRTYTKEEAIEIIKNPIRNDIKCCSSLELLQPNQKITPIDYQECIELEGLLRNARTACGIPKYVKLRDKE